MEASSFTGYSVAVDILLRVTVYPQKFATIHVALCNSKDDLSR